MLFILLLAPLAPLLKHSTHITQDTMALSGPIFLNADGHKESQNEG